MVSSLIDDNVSISAPCLFQRCINFSSPVRTRLNVTRISICSSTIANRTKLSPPEDKVILHLPEVYQNLSQNDKKERNNRTAN